VDDQWIIITPLTIRPSYSSMPRISNFLKKEPF
jgi:hypothetical protein